jgi:hypothetical protein
MTFRYPKPVRETEEVSRLTVEEARRDFIEQDQLAAARLLGGDPAKELADYTA